MPVDVHVTAVLQKLVGGAKTVSGEGQTVGEILQDIDRAHPGFLAQVTQGDGQLHRFVNVYLNDEDIRYLKQLETPVKQGDTLSILPALAGGR
jgi:sulfur-carrier protein